MTHHYLRLQKPSDTSCFWRRDEKLQILRKDRFCFFFSSSSKQYPDNLRRLRNHQADLTSCHPPLFVLFPSLLLPSTKTIGECSTSTDPAELHHEMAATRTFDRSAIRYLESLMPLSSLPCKLRPPAIKAPMGAMPTVKPGSAPRKAENTLLLLLSYCRTKSIFYFTSR